MKFTVNPCKGCKETCKEGSGINELNSCLTETAAAFADSFPNNSVLYLEGDAGINWAGCIQQAMSEMGRAPCNFQLNPAPVFVQAPHHFPELLRKTNNVKDSYNACLNLCQYNPHNNLECIKNCKVDMASIVEEKPKIPVPIERYEEIPTPPPPPPPPSVPVPSPQKITTYGDIAQDKPIAFWSSWIVGSIIFSLILIIIFLGFTLKNTNPYFSSIQEF